MTLQELLRVKGLRVAELARVADCNKSYLHHVIDGKKPLSKRVAIRIYRKLGEKLTPIEAANDSEIDALERFG